MKTIMSIVVIALFVAAPVNADLHAWIMGTTHLDSQDNEFIGRLGICNGDDNGDVEFGIESHWLGVHGKNQSYGAYGILHLFGDQDTWLGQPYIGYHASVASDAEDGGMYGPIAGTIYGSIFVLEGQYRDFRGKLSRTLADENNEWALFAGLRFKF